MLVLLTTVLSAVAILYSWAPITKSVKEYYHDAAADGRHARRLRVLDLFLFYVFWEISLIPMYLIIGIWGGATTHLRDPQVRHVHAFGTLLMLVAILVFPRECRVWRPFTFATSSCGAFRTPMASRHWPSVPSSWFAIKVPMWPLHTWLPDAHVEAPTAGSILLAGVLLKLAATASCARPAAAARRGQALAPIMIALAVIAILYGACVAMVQPDLKKLVAYSSVSHMGFVMLGIFVFNMQGLQGAVPDAGPRCDYRCSSSCSWASSTTHPRSRDRLHGGLNAERRTMPPSFGLFVFASIGLPGLAGFIGELLVLLGTFNYIGYVAGFTMLIVIASAVYMLWMYQRMFFAVPSGWMRRFWPALKDLSRNEWLAPRHSSSWWWPWASTRC